MRSGIQSLNGNLPKFCFGKGSKAIPCWGIRIYNFTSNAKNEEKISMGGDGLVLPLSCGIV